MNELIEALERDEALLVDDIIERMLAAQPNMFDKYSKAGPARTREDVAFHIQHLVGALAIEDPDTFADYYEWLLGVLLPRGITMEDIDLNFSCMEKSLKDRYGEVATPALEYLNHRSAAPSAAN